MKKISIGVMGLPIRKHNGKLEFLLSQRNQPGKPLWHHKWQQIGGGLEWGETPEQTLAREFEEEAQVSMRILYPHPIVTTSTWLAKDSKSTHDSHILLLTYIVSIDDQIPDAGEDEETAGFKWANVQEAIKLDCLPNLQENILELYCG